MLDAEKIPVFSLFTNFSIRIFGTDLPYTLLVFAFAVVQYFSYILAEKATGYHFAVAMKTLKEDNRSKWF